MIQSKKRERKGMNKALTEKGVNYSRLPFLFTFIFLFLISFSSAQGFIPPETNTFNYWTGNLTNLSEMQDVTIVNPQNTPSENARALKKVGRDLALGY